MGFVKALKKNFSKSESTRKFVELTACRTLLWRRLLGDKRLGPLILDHLGTDKRKGFKEVPPKVPDEDPVLYALRADYSGRRIYEITGWVISLLEGSSKAEIFKNVRRSKKKESWLLACREELREVQRVRRELVEGNMGLCSKTVFSYAKYPVTLPVEDLFQEASLGLMEAIDRYDLKRGATFGTMAIPWIRSQVALSIKNKGKVIRIPVRRWEDPNMMVTEPHVSMSMDEKRKEGWGGQRDLHDLVPSTDASLEKREMLEDLDRVLALVPMTTREQEIFQSLGEGKTLRATGATLGLSRERVRQIQVDTVERLRTCVDKMPRHRRSGRRE